MYLKLLTNTKDNIKDNPIPVYINTSNITEIGVKDRLKESVVSKFRDEYGQETEQREYASYIYSMYIRMTDGTMYIVGNRHATDIEKAENLAKRIALNIENLREQAVVDLTDDEHELIWRVLRPANG